MPSLSIDKAVELYKIQEVEGAYAKVLNKMNLPEVFTKYQTERGRNTNPSVPFYHTKAHTEAVVIHAYEGSAWGHLTKNETTELLIAALFHDSMHHGMGGIPDINNIRAALQSFAYAMEDVKDLKTYDEKKVETIRALIKATHYPHQAPFNLPIVNILRDADCMSAIYTHDRVERLERFLGLYNESVFPNHLPGNNEKFQEFIGKQQKFLLTYQWKTQWSRHKAFLMNVPDLTRRLVHDLQFFSVFDKEGYRVVSEKLKAV